MNDPISGAPMRAFRITLALGADSRAELADALRAMADRVELEELTGVGVEGGPRRGGVFEVLTNPEQTHDGYFREVIEYLKTSKGVDRG